MAKYIVSSDLDEDQIDKDISNFFGYLSTFCRDRLIIQSVNETKTGADGSVVWKGKPIYLQFKKPTGLKSTSSEKLPEKPRKNEAIQQKIRRYRKQNLLAEEPYSVCFELRKKAEKAMDLQHNVLFAHEDPPKSRAAYVCPTILRKKEYHEILNYGFLRRIFWGMLGPWQEGRYRFHVNDLAYLVKCVPLLREHAVIIPHAKVSSSDHAYSFSSNGSDVAFHSPELIKNDVLRLSDFIGREIQKAYDEKDTLMTADEIAQYLWKKESLQSKLLSKPESGEADKWLASYAELLKREFGIRQFLLFIGIPKT